VAQTRWVFCLCALASLATTLPGAVFTATPATLPAVLGASAALALVWVGRYLSGRAPAALDVAEAGAVTVLAVAGTDPAAVFGFVFSALWFRALYGTTVRFVLLWLYLAVGLVASLRLWALVPTHEGTVPPAIVLASIGNMLLTVVVARYLAMSLFAREEAQRRDAALVRLGQQLIGLTDRGEITARAHECSAAICAGTRGLSALLVRGAGDHLAVVQHVGALDRARARLPRSAVPPGTATAVARPVTDRDALAALPGRAWVCVALADQDDLWILLGAARRVPDEAVVAVQSMTNLVALAMRTSDAHQDLTTQATHDALTGLANRAAFTAGLEAALARRGGRVALLFLDLDDFKTVNDGLGHAAGDELLRAVAARLRWAVRPDDLCARLGGDEFAVLLRDADDTAPGVARRLVELVSSPVALKGQLSTVGVSIGLAFATAGTSAEELVQHADIAMYAAKAMGKNRVQTFDPCLLQQENGWAGFDAEIAAAADADELVVHYQPIVSVIDDRCIAVEALVRWQHPCRGLLGPGEFIDTAERTGAIAGIGAHVLRRACADAVSWTGPGGPLAVHVNVSAAQLTDPRFLDVVRGCLAEHGMAPDRLVLEITEGMVLDSAPVRHALDRLVELGVCIAMDDFGTGYSALSIIRTLPLHIVKLDKSFLSHGPSQSADEAVVAAIVQMAGRLGLHVVAEGVERPDQQRFLRCAGVDAAQGYLYLRPTTAEDFARWLACRAADDRAPGSVTPIGSRRTG
jgi:diguanylate cyclase (GGDEF)-like protein